MPEAYIVDAVRTPVGRRGGGLSAGAPGRPRRATRSRRSSTARASTRAPSRTSSSAASTPSARQAGDIARTAWLAAGLPEHVPGTTIDRQCGSSQQAVHFAAQGVMSGTQDLVVAGGVQNMSQIPISLGDARRPSSSASPTRSPAPPGWVARYGDQEICQFRGAEMIAEKWDISREEMEAFAVESHERAIRASAEGRFEGEIVAVDGVTADEGPREPNSEKIRSLPHARRGRPPHRRGAPRRSPTPRPPLLIASASRP